MAKPSTWSEALSRARRKLEKAIQKINLAERILLEDNGQTFRDAAAEAAEALRSVLEPVASYLNNETVFALPLNKGQFHPLIEARIPVLRALKRVREASFHDGDVSKHVHVSLSEPNFIWASVQSAAEPVPPVIRHRIAAGPNDPGVHFPDEFRQASVSLQVILDIWEEFPPHPGSVFPS